MDYFTLPLDKSTGKWVSLYLYKDVRNTKELREKLMSGGLSCCIIKASLVIDPFHVVVAANKAVLRSHRSKLTTKSIFTEILFSMSTSAKITSSLLTFGIHDDDKNIVVVFIHEENEREGLEKKILEQIDGDKIPILRISEFTDEAKIKKIYKVDKEEQMVSSLLDSVISRISEDSSVALK